MCRLILCVLLCVAATQKCFAQPAQPVVYTNVVDGYENRFLLSTASEVSGARYQFEPGEPVQFDRLTFVREVEFPDGRDNAPRVVRGWMYRGTDKSNVAWRLIFGKEQNTIPGTYPVYYASDTGDQFTRWKVAGGTTRRNSTLEDEILAILWANQVDIDRLGLQPFSATDQSPLAVSFAWDAIIDPINQRTKPDDVFIGWSLLTLPDGRLQVDLESFGNGDPRKIFSALGVTNDLNVKRKAVSEVRQVLASDISQEFFAGTKLNLDRVAEATRTLVERDSQSLRNLGLTTEDKIQNGKFLSWTSPWRPLQQGQVYHQFWKMQFSLEQFTEEQQKKYSLGLILLIGECRAVEAQFGEEKIVARYDSRDASQFSNLFVHAKQEGEPEQYYTQAVSRYVYDNLPPGVSEADPLNGFTLKDLFDDTFRRYVAKLKGQ